MSMTGIPTKILCGDTYEFNYQSKDYTPSAGYTMTFYLSGLTTFNKVGIDNGNGGWLFTLSTTDTSDLQTCTYAYQMKASISGKAYTDASGILKVKNILDAGARRIFAEKAIEDIEKAILSCLEDGNITISASIAGRSWTNYTLEQLEQQRAYYYRELASVTNKNKADGITTMGLYPGRYR